MSAAASKNSTNVRTQTAGARRATARRPPLVLTAARAGLRLLAPAAPAVAAACAERLFLTAPRHRRPEWEEVALANAESLRIPHDGSFLPAWRWGTGEATVLLVHGWEGRGSQLSAFVDPLLARGLSVVTFDAPGHGDAPTRLASLVEHARSVASASAYLGPLHGVIGHSVGGAATLLATRLGFHANRIALVAPPADPERFAAGFAQLLGLPDDIHQAMLARIERRYGFRMADLDVRADASRHTGPLLVVHDEEDHEVPLADGKTLADLAPAGRLITTKGLGHRRVLRAPEVLAAVIPFIADGVRDTSFAASIDGELYFREARW